MQSLLALPSPLLASHNSHATYTSSPRLSLRTHSRAACAGPSCLLQFTHDLYRFLLPPQNLSHTPPHYLLMTSTSSCLMTCASWGYDDNQEVPRLPLLSNAVTWCFASWLHGLVAAILVPIANITLRITSMNLDLPPPIYSSVYREKKIFFKKKKIHIIVFYDFWFY